MGDRIDKPLMEAAWGLAARANDVADKASDRVLHRAYERNPHTDEWRTALVKKLELSNDPYDAEGSW